LGKRTIDEGAMDEDGTMNYSEYVAILSGNTDLLDKVKLERKIGLLESEQKNYNRQLEHTGWSLRYNLDELKKKQARLESIEKDWRIIETRLPEDETGNRPNPVRLDNFEYNNSLERIGEKLVAIDQEADTNGEYMRIGSLLDFEILVKTDLMDNGKYKYNRFYIEGACKYSYNNGDLAHDPVLAAANFIKALGKIRSLIPKFGSEISRLKKDTGVMREIVGTPWKKSAELGRLRTELAALERKIQDALKQIDGPENHINVEKTEDAEVVAL
jgi:chromosome segregation ATPase